MTVDLNLNSACLYMKSYILVSYTAVYGSYFQYQTLKM